MKRLTEQRDYPLTMSMWAGESKDLRIYNRLAEIENILGDDYDLERLKELVEADREERCVILPCKIGTPIYNVRRLNVSDDDYRMSFHTELCVVSEKFKLNHLNCIGKTVFLTQEEAEAKLKEEK